MIVKHAVSLMCLCFALKIPQSFYQGRASVCTENTHCSVGEVILLQRFSRYRAQMNTHPAHIVMSWFLQCAWIILTATQTHAAGYTLLVPVRIRGYTIVKLVEETRCFVMHVGKPERSFHSHSIVVLEAALHPLIHPLIYPCQLTGSQGYGAPTTAGATRTHAIRKVYVRPVRTFIMCGASYLRAYNPPLQCNTEQGL